MKSIYSVANIKIKKKINYAQYTENNINNENNN